MNAGYIANTYQPQLYKSQNPKGVMAQTFSCKKINFKGALNADTLNVSASNILKKFKKFSLKEYEKLSEKELEILRTKYNKMSEANSSNFFQTLEKIHETSAEDIKSTFDKRYGKNKYKVIIIGRSLSSIGKVLGYKIGEKNVINIPLTNGKQYANKARLKEIETNGELDSFKKFLAKNGLTKEKIEKGKEKYILLDYCYTGKSLKIVKKLLTKDNLLGSKNIKEVDVKECIKNKKNRKILSDSLCWCRFKEYSFVDQAYDLSQVSTAVLNPSIESSLVKLVWFKLMDNHVLNQVKKNNSVKKTFISYLKKFLHKTDNK